ncbi:MAG: hypothetical protein R3F43_03765 [bacterium]
MERFASDTVDDATLTLGAWTRPSTATSAATAPSASWWSARRAFSNGDPHLPVGLRG